MSRSTAVLLITFLAVTTPGFAQQAPTTRRQPAPAELGAVPRDPTALTTVGTSAEETRRDLEEVLKQYPPSLPRILRLDPSLLSSPDYLRPYPALAAFLAQRPEVPHNPGYFLAAYDGSSGVRETVQERAVTMWRNAIEGFMIGLLMLGIAGAVMWLIRTFIEHRRWSRLSKIQTEVHNKLLDRFTANDDLLAYIQTPAGRRFLESAPIPIDTPRAIGAPLGRILWSAQAGAVFTVLGIGLYLVSQNTFEEVGAPLGAFGVVVIALGLGFIASAFLAYVLTRRFGLMADPNASQENRG
ncbi:MAG TPA: hypothetical protein VFK57_16140 [Vicinamibacterales bacterium]|nr:hypothetical protein [Vicinamibacterales bacterium]